MENIEKLKFIIDSTDAVQNAISLYDSQARLVFCNKAFRKNFNIGDDEDFTGMKIGEIFKIKNITVKNVDNDSRNMKMFDVLEKGETALDCEVRIVYGDSENMTAIVSNDMYPVKNQQGQIIGMIELSRSYQRNLNFTRKVIGLTADYTFENVVGRSELIKSQIRIAKEFASSPFNFLITGESGVGKEIFAQSAHNYSARHRGPFVAINCGSIPEELIESELFGYVGGAFTGASKGGQIGKFELADGGTLFLDEVGELPFKCQAKLLRVLETWTISRIGSSRTIPVNVRLITATNRDLAQMVREGLFREDLYYRLQVLTLELPPLRKRREDIIPLAENFIKQSVLLYTDTEKKLTPEAEAVLENYDWPGNIRELKNVINRAMVFSKTDVITGELAEKCIYAYSSGMGQYREERTENEEKPRSPAEENISRNKEKENTEGAEEEVWLSPKQRMERRMLEVSRANSAMVKEALRIAEGNKTKAAKILDVSRKTLYRMIEKYCPEELE